MILTAVLAACAIHVTAHLISGIEVLIMLQLLCEHVAIASVVVAAQIIVVHACC